MPTLALTDCLTIWTVYRAPNDYPHSWVLRGHEILPFGVQSHDICFVARTLDEVRAKVPPGTWCVGREPEDHAVIYESWIASADIGEVAERIRTANVGIRAFDPKPALGRLAARMHRGCRGKQPSGSQVAGNRLNLKFTTAAKLDLEARLASVNCHITEGEARIRKVGAVIERRGKFGLSTEALENLLNTMLMSLALMINTKTRVEAELKR